MASALSYFPVSTHAFGGVNYYRPPPPAAPASVSTSPVAMRGAKRKHSDSSDDDELDANPTESHSHEQSRSPTPKRRRCATIERGFEDLTLAAVPPPAVAEEPIVAEPFVVQEEPLVEEPDDVLRSGHPYSYYPDPDEFDEVVPPTREVRMHNSGWYEPEKDRIVITDLDASDSEAEAEADENGEDGAGLMVSPSLLDVLKRSSAHAHSNAFPPNLSTSTPNPTSALVLFRPTPWAPASAMPPPVIEVLEDVDGVRPPTPMPTDDPFEPALVPDVGLDVEPEPMDVDMMDVEDL